MTMYQLVAECAYVTVNTATGRAKTLLHKGALVPADAPEVKHLLSVGMIVKVGGDETGGVNADGATLAEATGKVDSPQTSVAGAAGDNEAPTGASSAEVQSESPKTDDQAAAELAERRKAAQAKLPEGGAMPHANAGQPVWVEWHVAQGGSYDDLAKADKADLIELAKSRQS